MSFAEAKSIQFLDNNHKGLYLGEFKTKSLTWEFYIKTMTKVDQDEDTREIKFVCTVEEYGDEFETHITLESRRGNDLDWYGFGNGNLAEILVKQIANYGWDEWLTFEE